jgi:hypothetical protein
MVMVLRSMKFAMLCMERGFEMRWFRARQLRLLRFHRKTNR